MLSKLGGSHGVKRTIVIAVLDDGVDIDHPNLSGRIAPGGRDFFVSDDHPEHENPRPKLFRLPFDQMAGQRYSWDALRGRYRRGRENRCGALGIAPLCRIFPIKIFHADDLASDETGGGCHSLCGIARRYPVVLLVGRCDTGYRAGS